MPPLHAERFASRRRIYLLRHGEVSYFDNDGRPFRPGTVPLNVEGRLQAEAAARALAEIPIDRAVSSTLQRSVDTLSIVAAGRKVAQEMCEEFCEIQPGRLADIPVDAVEAAFLGAFGRSIGEDTRFLVGETFGSLQERVLSGYRRLLNDVGWRQLLLVAHGGVNRVILCEALGIGLAGFGAIEQDAGCINIIDIDDHGRGLVRLINYTPLNPLKKGVDLTTMERLYLQYQGRREMTKSE
jgi:probable phosphoglycerate mutase